MRLTFPSWGRNPSRNLEKSWRNGVCWLPCAQLAFLYFLQLSLHYSQRLIRRVAQNRSSLNPEWVGGHRDPQQQEMLTEELRQPRSRRPAEGVVEGHGAGEEGWCVTHSKADKDWGLCSLDIFVRGPLGDLKQMSPHTRREAM